MQILDKKTKKKIKEASWKGEFRMVGRDPFVDWVIILTITVIFSVGLIYSGIQSFVNMDARLADIANSNRPVMNSVADTKALEAVISRFMNREKKSAEIINSYIAVPDPSI